MLHHNFKKGTPVLIILKDGSFVVDKFVDFKTKYFVCEKNKYAFKDIRSTGVYKEKGEVQQVQTVEEFLKSLEE